jgi:hypothetical protein
VQTGENFGVLVFLGPAFITKNTSNPMTTPLKIILAILLFLCLAKMPYGYYQLVRFVALVGFAILACQAHKQDRQVEMIIYGALALLFQPFFKVSLGRELWNVLDAAIGIGLLVSIFVKPKGSRN